MMTLMQGHIVDMEKETMMRIGLERRFGSQHATENSAQGTHSADISASTDPSDAVARFGHCLCTGLLNDSRTLNESERPLKAP